MCTVSLKAGAHAMVTKLDTELNKDILTFANQRFSGNTLAKHGAFLLQSSSPTDITWASDGASSDGKHHSGWEVCQVPPAATCTCLIAPSLTEGS